MRESTALIKEYNGEDELINESASVSAEAFRLPTRNWNLIIDSYNASNKKRFYFTALQCRLIVEHVKRGTPAESILKSVGVSKQKYTFFKTRYGEIEDRLTELQNKPSLTDEEYDEYNVIMRNPLRLLLSDIERAEGVSELQDWDRFNEMASKANDLQAMKMRAKFKEYFGDKPSDNAGFNVQINLGGDWLKDI